ncbi:MAG: DUF452 family protein [Chlorobiaceae bacterium]|nr:DUF452 family protein [Chlorobiaceae bacterium]
MNAEWIVNEGARDLLLFFNGWGMDRLVADYLQSTDFALPDHDVVVLQDYGDLQLPPWLREAMAGYRSVDLVAWSLGVWVAMHVGLEGIGRAVAINGTPFPIDAGRGIPPEIFRGTLENWSDVSRNRFERRMFTGCPTAGIDAVRSARKSAEQQLELRAIEASVARLAGSPAPPWRFTKAVIGARDLVFLPENQKRAWHDVPVTEVAGMPHFPFFNMAGLQEVFQ